MSSGNTWDGNRQSHRQGEFQKSEEIEIGADSQCAETINIAFGLSNFLGSAASSPDQTGSSSRSGAPWPIYKAGIAGMARP